MVLGDFAGEGGGHWRGGSWNTCEYFNIHTPRATLWKGMGVAYCGVLPFKAWQGLQGMLLTDLDRFLFWGVG